MIKDSVYDYLKMFGESTPTEIGLGLGYDRDKASAVVCRELQSLIYEGVVERFENGKRITYNLSKNELKFLSRK